MNPHDVKIILINLFCFLFCFCSKEKTGQMIDRADVYAKANKQCNFISVGLQ